MAEGLEQESHYWAFISYSHRDEKTAAWLHRSLESFRLPRELVGKAGRNGTLLPRRFIPIFRDREELPSSSDLAHSVAAALKRSRCLIVLCSPRSAASQWVNQEVETFKRLGRENAILSVILDGEPHADSKPELGEPECFPIGLRHPLGPDGALDLTKRTEPISADLRPGKDGRSNAFLKVVAGLAGVPFDALRRRARARRRMRLIQLTAIVIAAIASIVSAWHWFELRKRNELDAAAAFAAVTKADAAMNAGDPASQVALLSFALRRAPYDSLIATRVALALEQHNWARPEVVIPGQRVAAFTHDLIVMRDAEGYRAWSWRVSKPAGPVLPVSRMTGSRISPDGRIAWLEEEKQATLYSTLTGAKLAPPIAAQRRGLGFGRFTLDSHRIIASETTGPVIRDSTTGHILFGPLDFTTEPPEVVFSSDGSLFVLNGTNSSRIYETATGKPISPLRKDGKILAIEAEGRRFVVNSALWAIDEKEQLAPLAEPGHRLQHASFNPKGPELIVSENGNSATLWTTDPVVDSQIVWNEKAEVRDVVFSPEGARVLVSLDEHAQLHHLSTLPSYPPIPSTAGLADAPQFSPDGEYLAAIFQHQAWIWNIGPSAAFAEPLSVRKAYVLVRPAGAERMVAATQDGAILIADPASGKLIGEPIVGERRWDLVEISPNGTRAVAFFRSSNDNSKGYVFDLETGKVVRQDLNATGFVISVCFTGDDTVLVLTRDGVVPFLATSGSKAGPGPTFSGKKPTIVKANKSDGVVAAGFGDGTVEILEAGRLVRTIAAFGKSNRIEELFFTADGKFLLMRSEGSLVLWDLVRGVERFRATVQAGTVCPTAISQDGAVLAIAEERKVFVWDTRTKALLENPLQHSSPVLAIALSKDGQRLFTATEAGAVRQWATGNGDPLGQTLELNGRVTSIALTQDEQLLLIASQIGPLMIWETGKIRGGGQSATQSYRDDAVRLAGCAEAIAGLIWAPDENAFKQLPLTERLRRFAVLSSEVQTISPNESGLRILLRWLTSNPQRRSISPSRSITLNDLIEARLSDRSPRALQEAAFFSLGRGKGIK